MIRLKVCARRCASRRTTSRCARTWPSSCSPPGAATRRSSEFKHALAARPDDAKLKIGLATRVLPAGQELGRDGDRRGPRQAARRARRRRRCSTPGCCSGRRRRARGAAVQEGGRGGRVRRRLELASRLGIRADARRRRCIGGDVVDGKVRAAWDDAGGDDEVAEVERPEDHVQGRRRHGRRQGRDPDEDHPPADARRSCTRRTARRSAAAS